MCMCSHHAAATHLQQRDLREKDGAVGSPSAIPVPGDVFSGDNGEVRGRAKEPVPPLLRTESKQDDCWCVGAAHRHRWPQGLRGRRGINKETAASQMKA